MWGPPPAEFAGAGTPHDILMEEIMEIIMGLRAVEDFPDTLARWYAAGGQIMEDAVNLHFGG